MFRGYPATKLFLILAFAVGIVFPEAVGLAQGFMPSLGFWSRPASSCVHGKVTFSYTGSNQTFSVPTGCTSITVKAWGAGGGAYGSGWSPGGSGGAGGFTQATLNVTSGESLNVVVGGGGMAYPGYSAYGGGGQGTGGTASPGCDCGGSGGGRAEVNRASVPLIVAGGGGAGGANTGGCNAGGGGGGTNGGYPGNNPSTCSSEIPGDQSSYSPTPATATAGYGGGGGGGYKGGSGGVAVSGGGSYGDAGAGGSGYVTGTATTLMTATGTGAVNTADADYAAPAGASGPDGSNGSNGLIVVIY